MVVQEALVLAPAQAAQRDKRCFVSRDTLHRVMRSDVQKNFKLRA
jgi:hypothetical protein